MVSLLEAFDTCHNHMTVVEEGNMGRFPSPYKNSWEDFNLVKHLCTTALNLGEAWFRRQSSTHHHIRGRHRSHSERSPRL